jgi:uncharacterized membrane protein YoaK (UPF0700 family)
MSVSAPTAAEARTANAATGSDDEAPKRLVTSVRHPLARALLALTFTTGVIDAVSYLALGHVFTANMTGNIVLLGFGITGGYGLPVLAPVISLASFLLGGSIGGRLVKRLGERHPTLIGSALGIEVTLIAIAALIAAEVKTHPGHGAAYGLIALMACAMGVRNAMVRHIAVPDLTTTVLTMTLTGLAVDSWLAGGSGKGTVRRTAVVLAMLVGALCGAVLLRTDPWVPLLLAAAITLATCLAYVLVAERRATSRVSG